MPEKVRAAIVFGPLGALAVAAALCTLLPALNIAGDPTANHWGGDDLKAVISIGGIGSIALLWSIVTLVRAFIFRPYPLRMPELPVDKRPSRERSR